MKEKLTRNVRNPELKCTVMLYHGFQKMKKSFHIAVT